MEEDVYEPVKPHQAHFVFEQDLDDGSVTLKPSKNAPKEDEGSSSGSDTESEDEKQVKKPATPAE